MGAFEEHFIGDFAKRTGAVVATILCLQFGLWGPPAFAGGVPDVTKASKKAAKGTQKAAGKAVQGTQEIAVGKALQGALKGAGKGLQETQKAEVKALQELGKALK